MLSLLPLSLFQFSLLFCFFIWQHIFVRNHYTILNNNSLLETFTSIGKILLLYLKEFLSSFIVILLKYNITILAYTNITQKENLNLDHKFKECSSEE